MAEASWRKRVFIFGGALILVVALAFGAVVYLRHNKKTKSKPASYANYNDYLQKQAEVGKKKQISSDDVIALSDKLDAKKYDDVIAGSKILCPTVTGKDQLSCYNIYSNALIAKNDLKTLGELVPIVLNLEAIKGNQTALASWSHIKDSVQKGVNPNITDDAKDRE